MSPLKAPEEGSASPWAQEDLEMSAPLIPPPRLLSLQPLGAEMVRALSQFPGCSGECVCVGGCLGKLPEGGATEHSPPGLWAPDVSFWHRPALAAPHCWLLGRGHWQTQASSGSFAYHLHRSAYAVAQPGLLCI